MTTPTPIRPEHLVTANRTGIWIGMLVLGWAAVMATWDFGLGRPAYWLTLVSGAALLCCVPAWLVGLRVRRQHPIS